MAIAVEQGQITTGLIETLRQIVGDQFIALDQDSLIAYGHDETEHLNYPPEVVLKPRTAEEISAIMRVCNEFRIPVTPRGAGTGLSGGALPQLGGVLISTERMNTILEIDERNGQVRTEPGVITEVLQDAVKGAGRDHQRGAWDRTGAERVYGYRFRGGADGPDAQDQTGIRSEQYFKCRKKYSI